MSITRRDFMQASAVAGALGLVDPGGLRASALAATRGGESRAPKALRILILGGTSFLGPHQIRYALERGHSVSTFTRGRTEPTVHAELFGEVEQLTGDRESDLSALEGRTWDAVIDNSGQRVEWTRNSAQLLKDSVNLYSYTSSTGVYLPYLGDDITEDTELVIEDPPEVPEAQRPSYGVMKTLSERAAAAAFGADRTIVTRPTYIVGPADPTHRFPYWPARIERGGEVLVPGGPDDRVQYTDVRDYTEFNIRLIENGTAGTFNVAGPASPMTMPAFVHGIHAAVASEIEWVPIPDTDFLDEHGFGFAIPWLFPRADYHGAARINIDRAKRAGLTFRPLAVSTADTLAWWHSDAVSQERRDGAWSGERGAFPLTMEREAQIISAWRERSGGELPASP